MFGFGVRGISYSIGDPLYGRANFSRLGGRAIARRAPPRRVRRTPLYSFGTYIYTYVCIYIYMYIYIYIYVCVLYISI